MVSTRESGHPGNGFMHSNRDVGILLAEPSYTSYVVLHFILFGNYLSDKGIIYIETSLYKFEEKQNNKMATFYCLMINPFRYFAYNKRPD